MLALQILCALAVFLLVGAIIAALIEWHETAHRPPVEPAL